MPTAAQDRAAARREVAAAARAAARLARWGGPPGPRVSAGNDRAGITLLRFFPATRRVRAGATVEFSIAPRSLSFHTVTFGPVSYLSRLHSQWERIATGPGHPPRYRLNALTFLGSEPWALGSDPASPTPWFDGRNHGNGFLSLVAMDIDATPASPNPSRTRLRFTRPGTYRFECLVHPGMTGRIVVLH